MVCVVTPIEVTPDPPQQHQRRHHHHRSITQHPTVISIGHRRNNILLTIAALYILLPSSPFLPCVGDATHPDFETSIDANLCSEPCLGTHNECRGYYKWSVLTDAYTLFSTSCRCMSGWTDRGALRWPLSFEDPTTPTTTHSCEVSYYGLLTLHIIWFILTVLTLVYAIHKLGQSIRVIRINLAKKLAKFVEDRVGAAGMDGVGLNQMGGGVEPSRRGQTSMQQVGDLKELPGISSTASWRARTRANFVKPSFVTNPIIVNNNNATTTNQTRRATHGTAPTSPAATSGTISSSLIGESIVGGIGVGVSGGNGLDSPVDFAAVLQAMKGYPIIQPLTANDATTADATSADNNTNELTTPKLSNSNNTISRRMQTTTRAGAATLSPRASHVGLLSSDELSVPPPRTHSPMVGGVGGAGSSHSRTPSIGVESIVGVDHLQRQSSADEYEKQLTTADFHEDDSITTTNEEKSASYDPIQSQRPTNVVNDNVTLPPPLPSTTLPISSPLLMTRDSVSTSRELHVSTTSSISPSSHLPSPSLVEQQTHHHHHKHTDESSQHKDEGVMPNGVTSIQITAPDQIQPLPSSTPSSPADSTMSSPPLPPPPPPSNPPHIPAPIQLPSDQLIPPPFVPPKRSLADQLESLNLSPSIVEDGIFRRALEGDTGGVHAVVDPANQNHRPAVPRPDVSPISPISPHHLIPHHPGFRHVSMTNGLESGGEDGGAIGGNSADGMVHSGQHDSEDHLPLPHNSNDFSQFTPSSNSNRQEDGSTNTVGGGGGGGGHGPGHVRGRRGVATGGGGGGGGGSVDFGTSGGSIDFGASIGSHIVHVHRNATHFDIGSPGEMSLRPSPTFPTRTIGTKDDEEEEQKDRRMTSSLPPMTMTPEEVESNNQDVQRQPAPSSLPADDDPFLRGIGLRSFRGQSNRRQPRRSSRSGTAAATSPPERRISGIEPLGSALVGQIELTTPQDQQHQQPSAASPSTITANTTNDTNEPTNQPLQSPQQQQPLHPQPVRRLTERKSIDQLGGGSSAMLTDKDKDKDKAHPILGTPANIPDKPAFLLGLNSQRIERKRQPSIDMSTTQMGLGSVRNWNGILGVNGGGANGGNGSTLHSAMLIGDSNGIATIGGGFGGVLPNGIGGGSAVGGGTNIVGGVGGQRIYPSSNQSSPNLIRFFSKKLFFECLKHISFQYSFGAVLILILQLIHILLQFLWEMEDQTFENFDDQGLPTTSSNNNNSIRVIGSNLFLTVSYVLTYVGFGVMTHLFFGSHLKLAYSMIGLRGVTNHTSATNRILQQQQHQQQRNKRTSDSSLHQQPMPTPSQASQASPSPPPIPVLLPPTSSPARQLRSLLSVVKDEETNNDNNDNTSRTTHHTQPSRPQQPQQQPSRSRSNTLTTKSTNLFLHSISQEKESFTIKTYFVIHGLIVMGLLLTMIGSTKGGGEDADTYYVLTFIGAAIMIAHFGLFSSIYSISLRSLIAAGTNSLNVKQLSERKSVIYRLQLLIWTNRCVCGISIVLTILLAASKEIRLHAGPYFLPILSILCTTIVWIRLWSLNWKVRSTTSTNAAAVGQAPNHLLNMDGNGNGPNFRNPNGGTTAGGGLGGGVIVGGAQIQGLSSFKLRPSNQQLGVDANQTRRGHVRNHSASASSQSSK